MRQPGDIDLFEDFCKDKLPDDEIYVPPQHQPINPEDEDDVVPDQHAAGGDGPHPKAWRCRSRLSIHVLK